MTKTRDSSAVRRLSMSYSEWKQNGYFARWPSKRLRKVFLASPNGPLDPIANDHVDGKISQILGLGVINSVSLFRPITIMEALKNVFKTKAAEVGQLMRCYTA